MVRAEFGDGQAAAVDSDAVAEFHLRSDFGTCAARVSETHAQAGPVFAAIERVNFSDGFDYSRKHRESILRQENLARKARGRDLSAPAILGTSSKRRFAPSARRRSP